MIKTYAFGAGDVSLHIDMPEDEMSFRKDLVLSARRIFVEQYEDGSSFGVLEFGTAVYDDDSNILDKFLDEHCEMVITLRPKIRVSKIGMDALFVCDGCKFSHKKTMVSFGNIILSQYYFTNSSFDDPRLNIISIPPENDNRGIEDAIFKLARIFENYLKKSESKEKEITVSVEEFTNYIQKGIVPDRYKEENTVIKL